MRDWVFATWRESATRFGFLPFDGPPLESLELFTKKSGEEIVEQLYHFVDRGDREVALRPEMTPTLVRMVGARQRDYKKPLKWFSIPQVFRFEKPQKGRLREHFQWNCDIIGEESLAAEAELIALIVFALDRLGLHRDDFVVRISDRHYWQEFLQKNKISGTEAETIFQVLDKMDRTPEEESRKKLGKWANAVFEALEAGGTNARLDELMERLDAMGVANCCRLDLKIIRGLAYYTGVVFEVHDSKGEYRAIAGGGRYDNLIEQLSGISLPALGFGMGDVVISEILKDKGIRPPDNGQSALYLVIVDEEIRPDAMEWARRLREGGYRVDYPLSATKVGKQFQAAEDRNFSEALVLDSEWKSTGLCAKRNLKTRDQDKIRLVWKENGRLEEE